jgi:uncharacterized damage-inducible protein DinB
MSTIHSLIQSMQFNRSRTLGLLDRVEKEPEPQAILGWRPGPGRAHIAWQLTHVAITEELFATERLAPDLKPNYGDLIPRFKGGSTPDDNIPAAEDIRRILTESRVRLLATLGRFGDVDLGTIPEAFKERKLPLLDILHILVFHEAHHQGQAHITLNLCKAARSK